jgi:Uma2 family endonuclease
MPGHLGCVVSVEQFLKLPEIKPPLEFVCGRVIQKCASGMSHSTIRSNLAGCILEYAKRRKLGHAFFSLRYTFGGESRVPDVSFIARDRFPRDKRGRLAEDVMVAPDLAVEILHPGQTTKELTSKLIRSINQGVRLGWLIQPRKEQVTIYKPGRPVKVLRSGEILEGDDVLPGFGLPLDEMFGWVMED